MAKGMQEVMFAHVESWQKDKTSMKAYAEKVGISKNKFEYWCGKYKRIHVSAKIPAEFIELQPIESITKPSQIEKGDKNNNPSLKFELSLPDGLSLKIYN